MNLKKNGICIIFILLIISLCGCTEPIENGQVTGRTDLFKLVEYTVESFSENPLGDRIKIGDGFIHQANTTRFEIKGTIQNIGDYEADLDLLLKFYDKNDNLLIVRQFNINNLDPEEIRGFYDAVILNTHDYFPYVEKFTLEFVED